MSIKVLPVPAFYPGDQVWMKVPGNKARAVRVTSVVFNEDPPPRYLCEWMSETGVMQREWVDERRLES